MSESSSPKHHRDAAIAATAVMAMQFLAIFQPDAIPFDSEELYNAAHARLIQLDHSAQWLNLQYRGYCGGCTVNAGLGAILFSMFDASLATWKLVPILFMGTMTFFGARALQHSVGRMAVVPWTLLLCFSPPTLLELSMTAWGNHFESGVAAIIVLAATMNCIRRPKTLHAVLVGLSLSFALWIGLSSAFLVVGVVASLWRQQTRTQWAAVFVGLGPVLALWAYQWTSAPSPPFETIYYAGEQVPRLTRIPEKIWSLLAPRQLVALFGIRGDSAGWILGWTSAIGMMIGTLKCIKDRTLRPALLFFVSFIMVYSLVRFTVWAPPAPEIAPPGSMRYAAPMYGLLFFLLSSAIALFWKQNQRSIGIALLCPPIAVGIHARVAQFQAPFPDLSVFDMAAPDFDYGRDQIAYLLPLEQHLKSRSSDPMAASLHDFSIAWHETRRTLDQNPLSPAPIPSRKTLAAWEGVAAAVLPEIDPDQNGGIRTLIYLQQRIDHFPEVAQIYIHAEATSRRNWDDALAEHNNTRLEQWALKIQNLPPMAQRGAMMSFGTKWAEDIARWREPQRIHLPNLSGQSIVHQQAFMEGFALGIGERWGPKSSFMQETIPEPLSSAWNTGRSRGIAKRWLTQTR